MLVLAPGPGPGHSGPRGRVSADPVPAARTVLPSSFITLYLYNVEVEMLNKDLLIFTNYDRVQTPAISQNTFLALVSPSSSGITLESPL